MCIVLPTEIPSAILAITIVAASSFIPVKPMKPRVIVIGNRLGIMLISPILTDFSATAVETNVNKKAREKDCISLPRSLLFPESSLDAVVKSQYYLICLVG